MPTLRFHAVDTEKFITIADTLQQELATLFELPKDYIGIEIVTSQFIDNGRIVTGFPMVEILSFKRDVSIEDEAATIIHHALQSIGYAESECYYNHKDPRHYYVSGKNC